MALAKRFADNPLLTPADVPPTRDDFVVEVLLNPGVFRWHGKTGLLMRVCERPPQEKGWISLPILDPQAYGGIRIHRFRSDDPKLKADDPRVIHYDGEPYLTTLSHLRLAWSEDGHQFTVEKQPALIGEDPLESYGIEDARVSLLDGQYLITYSMVSSSGVGVGLVSTRDWKNYRRHGMILPPANKDAAIFEQKVGGKYLILHRPSGVIIGGNYIWLASSPDLRHWGEHRCLMHTRRGMWDSQRIGAGAAPIATSRGFLEIYHGADNSHRYCLGTMLLDGDDPTRLIGRSEKPILEPEEEYEKRGFFGNVVFTNGHIVDGDVLTVYYGAADSVICAAQFSIDELLKSL